MLTFRMVLYAVTCLSFTTVIGAAVYEHVAVVPQWAAAPPASLTMFQGKYGLHAQPFWIAIHPVTLLLFIATLTIFWKTGSRVHVLLPLSLYAAILVATGIYFVPQLLSIIQTPLSDTVDAALTVRAKTWETWSLLRLGLLIVGAIYLLLGLSKTGPLT